MRAVQEPLENDLAALAGGGGGAAKLGAKFEAPGLKLKVEAFGFRPPPLECWSRLLGGQQLVVVFPAHCKKHSSQSPISCGLSFKHVVSKLTTYNSNMTAGLNCADVL